MRRCVQWNEWNYRKVWHVEAVQSLVRRNQMIGFWIWQEGVVDDLDKSSFIRAVEAKIRWEWPKEIKKLRKREVGREGGWGG